MPLKPSQMFQLVMYHSPIDTQTAHRLPKKLCFLL